MPTNASLAFSTQITHVGSGASVSAGGISGTASISTALVGTGNLARYDRCDAVLMIAPTASIALANTQILLFRRDINIDGTNAEVQSECTDALNAYDPPTNTEMEARTLAAASYATAVNLTTLDTLVDRLATTTIGNASGAGTGTKVFVYGGVTATVTVDDDGNRTIAFS